MVANETAKRIVEIHGLLLDANLEPAERERLTSEQRDLWDREYAGKPFDEIADDYWLTKRSTYL